MEDYLIHVLCRIGSVLDDDGLVPGQSVENCVLIHIRYSLEDISHDIEKKRKTHPLSFSRNDAAWDIYGMGLRCLDAVLVGWLDSVGFRPLHHAVFGTLATLVARG